MFDRDTIADFFFDVNAMLAGNGDTDVAGDGGTLLTWEWDASFLFLDSAIFLGEVGTLGTVNAVLTGNIGALLKRFLVTDLSGYLGANLLGHDGSNRSRNGESGVRETSRDKSGSFTLGSLKIGLEFFLRGLQVTLELFFSGLLSELGLLGGSLPDMSGLLHSDDLALLFEMSNADILLDGLANLLDHGRAHGNVDTLLLPGDVAKGNGVALTLLFHDERTRLLVLWMALTGLESRTSRFGFDLTGFLVVGPASFLPNFIDDGGTLDGDGHSRSDDRQSGNSREDGKLLTLRSFDSILELLLGGLNRYLLFVLRDFVGVQILVLETERNGATSEENGDVRELHDVLSCQVRGELRTE